MMYFFCLISLVPPKFTKEPINQQVLKGDMAQLTCTVIAVPPVRIDWSKDIGGKFVTVRIDHPRFQKLLNGTLVIRNVSEEDDGKYLCTAYNTVSEQESRHVMLTVHGMAYANQLRFYFVDFDRVKFFTTKVKL